MKQNWLFKTFIVLVLIAVGAVAGYYFGYDVGFEKAVQESPEQLPADPNLPGDSVACTMEAKLCPDD